jgi:mRNA interferase MazF
VKRGEIWTMAGGPHYAGKPRPAVIVQDDRFETPDSVTVCSFTTDPTEAPLFRLIIEPDESNGLREASRLMVDKITSLPRNKLGKRVGCLGTGDMLRLNRAMLMFLGLGRQPARTERSAL